MHHEMHGMQLRQYEALHLSAHHAREMRLHAVDRQQPLDQVKVCRVQCDHAQRGAVALVAGAGQGDVAEGAARCRHAFHSRTSTRVRTASRGIRVEATATTLAHRLGDAATGRPVR